MLNAVLLSYILIQQNRQQIVQAKMAAAVTKMHQAKLQQATQTCTDSDNNAA